MEILAQASEKEEIVKIIEIDPTHARNKMVTQNNHIFEDRRVDLYRHLINSNNNK
jgi:hypothetical protein